MKKTLFLIPVLVFAVFLAGCVFTPPYELPEDPIKGESPDKPVESGGEDSSDIYSVTLVCENKPFYPTEPLFALWTGDEGVHMAQFNVLGVAEIADLDGEYRVTLANLPYGFTYDVNGYTADNTKMDVTIEILKIIKDRPANAPGVNDLYHCEHVNSLGTYRTAITSPSQWIYYEFVPTVQGTYSIESWVDITANDVNPKVRIYTGTSSMKYLYDVSNPTIDEGGKCSTYTKNFRYEVSLRKDELGATYTFAIGASKIGNTYPVTVDFSIRREGDVEGLVSLYNKVVPEHKFDNATKTKPAGTFGYIYKQSGYILKADNIFYNEADDYYHVNDINGPLLYAKLGVDSEILQTDSGRGFLDPLVDLKFLRKDYYEFMDYYVEYSNSDGVHPVTAELKEFLFDYACNQRYFNDGYGWAELMGLNSNEENQWLFNCGYYS